MTAEKLAVIVYGVVAYLAALVLGVMAGSKTAVAFVFAAAGITYVFQVAQLYIDAKHPFHDDGYKTSIGILDVLMAAAIAAVLLSVVISLFFGG